MRETRTFITVGAVFLIAAASLFVTYTSLRGALTRHRTVNVEFADAQGIKAGSEVRMAGVRIGSVGNVALTPDTNRALLSLYIDEKFRIPEGSRFLIATSLIGSMPNLMVVPGETAAGPIPDNATRTGESGASLDVALKDGRELLVSLRKTTDKLAEFSTDPRTLPDLRATLSNLRAATADLPELERQTGARLQRLLESTERTQALLGARTATLIESADRNQTDVARSTKQLIASADRQATGIGGQLQGTIQENRKNLKTILVSTNETVENLTQLLKGTQSLVKDLQGTVADPKIRQNLVAVTENLALATTRLSKTSEDLQRLSGDPEITANLKATTLNIREATANARDLTGRFAGIRIPGERRRPAPAPTTPGGGTQPSPPADTPPSASELSYVSLIESGLAADALYDTKAERFRLDTNFTLPRANRTFYRVGLFDIAEGNKLSLQAGRALGDNGALRYGILFGKLGLGADYRFGPLDLRIDVFDPNRATVNSRVKARVGGGGLSVTAGVDSIGKENRTTVGLQIRR